MSHSPFNRGLSIDTNLSNEYKNESNHISPSSSSKRSSERFRAVATPTFDNRRQRESFAQLSRSPSKVSEKNPSDRDTNVQVCVRLRPILPSDQQKAQNPPRSSPPNRIRSISRQPSSSWVSSDQSSSYDPFELDMEPAWTIQDNRISQSEHTHPESNRRNVYAFDHSFGPDHTNYDIYNNTVKDAVISAMEGYHSSVFAYGQTATGKKRAKPYNKRTQSYKLLYCNS